MEANFWHARWEENLIGFHLPQPNPKLVEYFKQLNLKENDRVLVPLCGKTIDIAWLLAQGMRVVGVELSPLAIEQLFAELKVTPANQVRGKLNHYSAPQLDIFVGDIFDLDREILGHVDAIYDRAAIVALPDDLRERYAAHLINIAPKANQLLISYEYDQSLIAGPPFSVTPKHIQTYYQATYKISELVRMDVEGGLKGLYPAQEAVWLLKTN
ncbi:MAG: thiopurine S-methyltransferase [Bacteriovoracia bacterium]